MRKDFFYFKQFKIMHNQNVMKVGTDSVLLGSFVNCGSSKNILDVGTGSGVIAIMLAQKSSANIDAIDILDEAIDLARINVSDCKWAERVNVLKEDIKTYYPGKCYDIIVSNPPYYATDIISPDIKRATARHNKLMSATDLFAGVNRLLKNDGIFYVIYPHNIISNLELAASSNSLIKTEELLVFSNYKSEKPTRVISGYSRTNKPIERSEIRIEKHNRGEYTDEYKNLTKEYYLVFARKRQILRYSRF